MAARTFLGLENTARAAAINARRAGNLDEARRQTDRANMYAGLDARALEFAAQNQTGQHRAN